MDTHPATLAAFARLYHEAIEPGTGAVLDYTLDVPRWQFLCWLCDTQDVLLHGSGDPAIEEFEPRKSNDSDEFGNRTAVYAASDGIWPIYFALVNRQIVKSLVNACFRVVPPAGEPGDPYYFFSINAEAMAGPTWRNGTIYILPRAGFEHQPREQSRGREVDIAQWASLVPVRPLARLAVTPKDFPFLQQVRAHDMAVVSARSQQDPDGFPWLDE
jgi:hypothetical protein